jgi:hypothetical protein
MLKSMEIGEQVNQTDQTELKERVEATLCRLRELRERVAELKRRCEDLRAMEAKRVEKCNNKTKCDKCGRVLEDEEGVVVKDGNGEEKSRYHKACFEALFK